MNKNLKIAILTLFVVSCSTKNSEESKTKASKPNIILFVADDHGKDALGCYGNQIIQTPNLDQLAAEGVRFNNAYCTSASCAASRSVILTGQYGHATGSYGHVHDYHHFSTYNNVKSLPVLLEQAGYETARIGKYHVAPEKVYHFNTVLKADPRSTLEMADACIDVIKSQKPFFLYFCPDDPHRGHPFQSDPWYLPNPFGNKKEPYPGEKQVIYDPKEVVVPDFLPDTKESREEIAQYYQSISRIDQGFGRLMKHLKDARKLDSTIIFYISDNGMAFPGAKTTVYEPGIQLPCIIKNPFQKENKGGENNAKISWVDLTPTILDMTKVDYNTQEFHGKSFNDIIEQERPKGWDIAYASHTFHEITMYYPMKAVIKGKYKLIWNIAWQLDYPFASDLWASSTWQSVYRNHKKMYGNKTVDHYLKHAEFELFDLENDTGEIYNLSDKKEYQEILKEMKAELKEFQKKTKDPWLIMWDHDSSFQGTGVDL